VSVAGLAFFPDHPASGQEGPTTDQPAPGVGLGGGFWTRDPIVTAYSHRFAGNDPEMLKIWNEEANAEREAARLIKDYAGTDKEDQREKIKGKLSDVLGKEFDFQQKRRDLELSRLEAQVKKLRDLMKKRNDARQTIVEKRLDQLIREAEGLGWTAPRAVAVPNIAGQAPPAASTVSPLRPKTTTAP
jgi:hypothetical protein